jgi:hypothetical protein
MNVTPGLTLLADVLIFVAVGWIPDDGAVAPFGPTETPLALALEFVLVLGFVCDAQPALRTVSATIAIIKRAVTSRFT